MIKRLAILMILVLSATAHAVPPTDDGSSWVLWFRSPASSDASPYYFASKGTLYFTTHGVLHTPNLVVSGNTTATVTTATRTGHKLLPGTGIMMSPNSNFDGSVTTTINASTTASALAFSHTPGVGINGTAYNGSVARTWSVTDVSHATTATRLTHSVTAGTGLAGGSFDGSTNITFTLAATPTPTPTPTPTATPTATPTPAALTFGTHTNPSGASYNGTAARTIDVGTTQGYAWTGLHTFTRSTGVPITATNNDSSNYTIDITNSDPTGNTIHGLATGGIGVTGEATAGLGVVGIATSGTGVQAQATGGTALNASSTSGVGITATSTSGRGLTAFSSSNDAALIQGNTGTGLVVQTISGTNAIRVFDHSNTQVASVVNTGQLRTSDSLVAQALTASSFVFTDTNKKLVSTSSALLPFANIANGSALSVLGRASNSSGVMASIASTADNMILRQSGTSIGFGAINLTSSAAVGNSILALVNGGTGSSNIYNAFGSWGTQFLINDSAWIGDPNNEIWGDPPNMMRVDSGFPAVVFGDFYNNEAPTIIGGNGISLVGGAAEVSITGTGSGSGNIAFDANGTGLIHFEDPGTLTTYGNGGTCTIAAGTGAGTGASISLGTGSKDLGGIVNLTAGLAPAVSSTIVTITLSSTASNSWVPVLTPANTATALLVSTISVTGSTTTWTINAGATGLTNAVAYKWFYSVRKI